MIKVVWNIIKYVFGIIFSVFRPLKRLICQRRKSSETEGAELTSIGTGSLILETPLSYSPDGEVAEVEMQSWDTWDSQTQPVQNYKASQSGIFPENQSNSHRTNSQINGFGSRTPQGYSCNKKEPLTPDTEPEINFFEDMTPQVKRQPKILIRKKDPASTTYMPSMTNRLTVMSDIPFSNSELEAWEDGVNAWDTEEASEDLSWQVEEALKENKRKERMERHIEQQKKKQKKDEIRGMRSGSTLATRLS